MRQFVVYLSYLSAAALLMTGLSSCTAKAEDQVAQELQGLYMQLQSSCKQAQTYEKTVYDLNISPAQQQDSLSNPSAQADDFCILSMDLRDAYSQYFDQEGLAPYFDKRTAGDTLIGEIKAAYQAGIELQQQKIVKEGERFIYFESRSSKKSWLYELDLRVKLFFDEKGRYSHHSLDIYNTVPLLKEEFKSRIEGKAIYP